MARKKCGFSLPKPAKTLLLYDYRGKGRVKKRIEIYIGLERYREICKSCPHLRKRNGRGRYTSSGGRKRNWHEYYCGKGEKASFLKRFYYPILDRVVNIPLNGKPDITQASLHRIGKYDLTPYLEEAVREWEV